MGSHRQKISSRRLSRRKMMAAVTGGALIVAAGLAGVSYASIPDAGTGLIHSCYSTTTGAVRINDVAKTPTCHTGETALTWYKGAPAPTSVSGQVANDNTDHVVARSSGQQVAVNCWNNGTSFKTDIIIKPTGTASFWGWGTASDGNTIHPARVQAGANGQPAGIVNGEQTASNSLDVVASATASGAPTKYTRFDVSVVQGSMCNYHIMIIPSS